MLKRLFFLLCASTILAQPPIVFEVDSLGFSPGSRISITYPSIFRTNSNAKVSATVGGKPAYIVGHNPFGIDAQIPFELEAGATTLIVTVDGTQLAPFNLRLETFAPGIASCTGDSRCDFGSFLNFNGRFIGPQTPAVPGDPLLAAATGLGPTNPPTATGPAQSKRPTANPVTLTIAGKAAEVTFAGLSTSAIGDYSLNFKVWNWLNSEQCFVWLAGNCGTRIYCQRFCQRPRIQRSVDWISSHQLSRRRGFLRWQVRAVVSLNSWFRSA